MAIKTTNAKQMNKAIVDKVDKILSNMDSAMSVDINIQASVGNAPCIKYNIEEFIKVKDSEEK